METGLVVTAEVAEVARRQVKFVRTRKAYQKALEPSADPADSCSGVIFRIWTEKDCTNRYAHRCDVLWDNGRYLTGYRLGFDGEYDLETADRDLLRSEMQSRTSYARRATSGTNWMQSWRRIWGSVEEREFALRPARTITPKCKVPTADNVVVQASIAFLTPRPTGDFTHLTQDHLEAKGHITPALEGKTRQSSNASANRKLEPGRIL
eukprot:CAMPEP_0202815648 /NCGR_PEP_ID=MMETSP1389-20130828/6385_1 /ASSEMBLY_ACC=CAM_ASM_000865 /TAXON_ID=302021 /ORGANISM="Rhodomonas sp., Strain CCMP768" /LENGTH=207 /DNA_ID=CAMNT_0049487585 /DNA_START=83 /DNA_END=706 /DNA_ORIENTATION=-